MSVKRFDSGNFRTPVKTKQGFLKADAYATRVGIFSYSDKEGNIVKEFRSPEEVFRSDTLKSLSEITVTNEHPPEFISSDNSKKYSVGFTSEKVDQDGIYTKVGVTITDAQTILEAESGKVETSCGYICDVEKITGEWKGEKYDAVQKNIIYNHLAIVKKGRAGSDVRIRLDSDDAQMIDTMEQSCRSNNISDDNSKKETNMAKFKIDSVEFETEDTSMAQAIVKKCDALDDLQRDNEKLQGKFDASQEEIKNLKNDIEKIKGERLDQTQIMSIAKARIDLENKAKSVLGEEFKIDALSDIEIKKEVIKSLKPELVLAEKSDAYVDGCFDIVSETCKKKQDAEQIISSKFENKEKSDSQTARQKMIEESRALWTKPVGRYIEKNA